MQIIRKFIQQDKIQILCYIKYLKELTYYLKEEEFQVGIRTNGLLSLQKIEEINQINELLILKKNMINDIINMER